MKNENVEVQNMMLIIKLNKIKKILTVVRSTNLIEASSLML